MTYREIGGIRMSSVCMGCWNISGDWTWGSQDEKDSEEAVKAALSEGVNFFDTAEAYGQGYSEEFLGRMLSPVRGEAVIATKTARLDPAELKKACEDSLKRLRTDYIDVYYLHWPDDSIPFEETAGALEELAEEGKIRIPAVSNFGPGDLSGIMKYLGVGINQVGYNLLFRAPEYEVIPSCAAAGVAVAAYSPLSEGLLTGKFKKADDVPEGRARTRHFSRNRPHSRHSGSGCEPETFDAVGRMEEIAGRLDMPMAGVAIAWLLKKEEVGFVVAGSRNGAQSRANARAAGLVLPEEALAELDEAGAALKGKMGRNPDMWQSDSRIK